MFCEDCRLLLCPVCALLKHRQCSKLNAIAETANARRLQMKTSQKELLAGLAQIKQQEDKVKKDRENLSRSTTINFKELNEAYDTLLAKIKEQKGSDMLKMHGINFKVQRHLVAHEEDVDRFISLLEGDIDRVEKMQLKVSDIQLLRETNPDDLKQAVTHISDLNTYIEKVRDCRFEIPVLNKARFEEIQQVLDKLSMLCFELDSSRADDVGEDSAGLLVPTKVENPSTVMETCPARLSCQMGPNGNGHTDQACSPLLLQTTVEVATCGISVAPFVLTHSPSSSQSDKDSDSQRNPFSMLSIGKKLRPKARPRNSSARRSVHGSVFSVKHPVVTAASSTTKQTSPKKSTQGFVFTPVNSTSAIFTLPTSKSGTDGAVDTSSHSLPVPKSGAASLALDTGLLVPKCGTCSTQATGGGCLAVSKPGATILQAALDQNISMLHSGCFVSQTVTSLQSSKAISSNGAAVACHTFPKPKIGASNSMANGSNTLPTPKPRTAAPLGTNTIPRARESRSGTDQEPAAARDVSEALVAQKNVMAASELSTTLSSLNAIASGLSSKILPPSKPNNFAGSGEAPLSASSVPATSQVVADAVRANGSGTKTKSAAGNVLANEASPRSSAAANGGVSGQASAVLVSSEKPRESLGNSIKENGDSSTRADAQKLRTVFSIRPVSAGDSRRPIISDFAILPNRQLAVVDRANSRVKLVQMTVEEQGQGGLCPAVDLTTPHGMCHMDGEIVAVVSHAAKTLQLVHLGNHRQCIKHTYNTCRGYTNVARLTTQTLAARFSLGVHILDVGGPALRLKAAIVNDSNGKPLFRSPTAMCTTQDGKIVVLDGILLDVSCWDQTGALLWRLPHPNLFLPRSLCSVGLRRLYCLCGTTRLDCLSAANGKLLHSVKLEAGPLKEVSTVAQDPQGRILINNVEEVVCFAWA